MSKEKELESSSELEISNKLQENNNEPFRLEYFRGSTKYQNDGILTQCQVFHYLVDLGMYANDLNKVQTDKL